MAYSRWDKSRWHTYQTTARNTLAPHHKNEQTFQIASNGDYDYVSFKYPALVKDIEACLDEACKKCGVVDPVSFEEREELRTYMQQFIDDIIREFPKKGKRHGL